MLEQFFDICRLYPLGRLMRRRKRPFYGYPVRDGQWAKDYTTEMQRGIVLLQRQEYLESRRQEIMATIQHKVTDSGVIYELEDIEAKILQVKDMYLAHEQRMRTLFFDFKSNSFSREVLMAQKPQYRLITGKQPYAWVQRRNECSRSGGCCGRECGCCEKPLKVVFKHRSSVFGPTKKKSGVYGHCTSECGCCIRYKGCYKPNSWFEKASKPESTA